MNRFLLLIGLAVVFPFQLEAQTMVHTDQVDLTYTGFDIASFDAGAVNPPALPGAILNCEVDLTFHVSGTLHLNNLFAEPRDFTGGRVGWSDTPLRLLAAWAHTKRTGVREG